jgi:endonuclease-3
MAQKAATRKPAKTRAKTGAKTGSKTSPKTGASSGRRKSKGCAYGEEELVAIFSRFALQRPDPKGELEHVNAFTLLVAVVLSAQATDAGVNKATRELFRLADTPQKMLALGEDRVRDLIKTIGLFRNKAKNVIALSQMLMERFGGEVPASREELVQLPGVGRKTANVVLLQAFGQPTIAVDTHVFRLANRLLLAPGKTPDEVEAALEKTIPAQFLRHAHHWLILHGRYVCVARKPKCGECIIADLCKSPEKTASQPAQIVAMPQ